MIKNLNLAALANIIVMILYKESLCIYKVQLLNECGDPRFYFKIQVPIRLKPIGKV